MTRARRTKKLGGDVIPSHATDKDREGLAATLLSGFFLSSLLAGGFTLRNFFLGGFFAFFNGHPKSPLSNRSGGFGGCLVCNSQSRSYWECVKPSTVFLKKFQKFFPGKFRLSRAMREDFSATRATRRLRPRFFPPATSVRRLRIRTRACLRLVRRISRRARAESPRCERWRDATTSFRSWPAR